MVIVWPSGNGPSYDEDTQQNKEEIQFRILVEKGLHPIFGHDVFVQDIESKSIYDNETISV